ncbi:MAG: helix-turn-helix transcriptional regulator [Opitutae bacterium]|nr:helix-turn-helix transcriptional regulator [Opitutae bacterium]
MAISPSQPSLDTLLTRLASPMLPLLSGRRGSLQSLPDNVICFRRNMATHLNRAERGRFLHHRFTLILALRTSITVCVDDRAIRLNDGEGLLVFPFQFHHYVDAAEKDMNWLFITFEMIDVDALAPLKFRPFKITPIVRQVVTELVHAYLLPNEANLTILLLAVLLARIQQAGSTHPRNHLQPTEPGLVMHVSRLAQQSSQPIKAKEMARALGISVSHLRTQFQLSSGLSLARHLRHLRLEKACGLLRLTTHRITEIAELCGFSSIYCFSRAFRHAYGVSPLAYRQNSLGGRVVRSSAQM